MNTRKSIQLMLAVLIIAPVSVRAEDSKEAKQEVNGLWNVDRMMEQAAENISRRYNLNDGQKEMTKKMLVQEVTKFLDEHEDIWPLVRDLGRYQIEGKAPEGEMARRIGENAMPLLSDIRETILRCNEDWDSILNEEQRKLHEWDLRDMDETFAKMEENFSAMREGKPRNPGIFPAPNKHDEPAPRVRTKPNEKFKPKLETIARESRLQEDTWDAYVQGFIKRYQLDDSQSESAQSILRECKVRASAYRKSKDRDFMKARKRLQEARKAEQPEKLRKTKEQVWTKVLKNLRKPVEDLFQELKDRLARLPSAAQKKRAGDPPSSANPPKSKSANSKPPESKSVPKKPTKDAPPPESNSDGKAEK